jgi:dTDP-4-amino-4,6-dideoxygalactose transaminase
LRVLQAENILARRYFFPGCHRMEPYRTLYPQTDAQLPKTRRIADRVLVLPGGSGVSTEDAREVCGVLGFVLGHADEIIDRLRDPQFAEVAR